ncbi:MAG: septal ring lytic transglycosylase RlpA family protein, partial [Betaproteobacteria bacterium]
MPPSNNRLRATRGALAVAALAVLAACQTTAPPGGPGNVSRLPPGNAQRDGPEAKPPPDLDKVPDAVPQIEAIRNGGPNKPYEIAGKTYVPVTDDRALTEKGLASWYGKKFHGRRTASGEAYNMYAMTAAHKTLPIPSYARVRNPANGREVIVRVNDRGPFSPGRIIDLSYTAALKLGVLNGVAPVEISRITEDDIRTGAAMRKGPTLAGDAPPAKEAPVAMTVGELDRPANARAPDARNGAASRARAAGKTALPSVVTLAPAAGDVLATTVAPAPTAVDKSVLAGVQSPAATSTN